MQKKEVCFCVNHLPAFFFLHEFQMPFALNIFDEYSLCKHCISLSTRYRFKAFSNVIKSMIHSETSKQM